jgi:hypothetical protein
MSNQLLDLKSKNGELANWQARAYPCLSITQGIYIYVNLIFIYIFFIKQQLELAFLLCQFMPIQPIQKGVELCEC